MKLFRTLHLFRNLYPALRGMACCALLASCGPSIDTAVVVRPVSAKEQQLADEVLAQATFYRQSKGGVPLQRNAVLDRMARQHSEFLMANRGKFQVYGPNISHYGVEQRAMAARQFYGMEQISENVVSAPMQGPSTASYLVDLWKSSPSHDFNLLHGWTNTGVGVVIDADGTVFLTQLFGSRVKTKSHRSMLDSLRAH
jgi:uncharacterized protein YkwD